MFEELRMLRFKNKILTLVLIAFLFGAATIHVIGQFSGSQSSLPFYVGAPSPYSWIVDTNSTHYFAYNGTTGALAATSSSCDTIVASLIAANKTIEFRVGDFPINSLHQISVSGIHFTGQGKGTQFTIGASGGFNISHTDNLRDITFECIWFEGAGSAVRVITSAMAINKRITEFRFSYNWVWNFYATNAIGLNFSNLENSEISFNTFFKTHTAHIQLTSNNYFGGNNRLIGNEFYTGYNRDGENIMKLVAKHRTTSSGGVGGIYSSHNHFYGESYHTTAWNLTTIQGTIGGIRSVMDRTENAAFLWTKTANSTWEIGNIEVAYLRHWNDNNNIQLFNIDANTADVIVSFATIDMQGSSNVFFRDNRTSSSHVNQFVNNVLTTGSGATYAFSYRTIVKGNMIHIMASYTVKTAGANNIRNGNNLCNWGASNNNIVSATKYLVLTNDVYLKVSGGTVSNIIIYDPNGNIFTDLGSSATGYLIPYLFSVNITYSVAPTISFCWKP